MCIPLLLLKDNELTETRIRPMIRSTIRQDFLQTFGGILLDDVDLISPWMQGTILLTVSKVDCPFLELWCQEKGCLYAQRIKDILLAVCDLSADYRIVQGLITYQNCSKDFPDTFSTRNPAASALPP